MAEQQNTTTKLIVKTYEHNGVAFDVPFTDQAFFNATIAAKTFGKRPQDWLRTELSQDYIKELSDSFSVSYKTLVRINQGGEPKQQGTWLHNSMKDEFYRWLNLKCRSSSKYELYVVLFSTGIIKVGTSYNVIDRLRRHNYEASKFGVSVVRQYVCKNPSITENDLISYCELYGTPHVGKEYFTNIDFDLIVSFMKGETKIETYSYEKETTLPGELFVSTIPMERRIAAPSYPI